ncbi:MAG: N-acetylmuramoyl-L-alanine amidase [Bacteroidia bacterium]|nr:N-acetylmuramoyl-L-alanine amidase [Bacteroidia bacterium]
MKNLLFALFFCIAGFAFSQIDVKVPYRYASLFDEAYQLNPDIPRGVLEAVAYTNSRIWHIPADEPESCTGMPRAYGVMGLILDGKNWFHENLKKIAALSGYSQQDIINSPDANIKAYAAAYAAVKNQLGITSGRVEDQVNIFRKLSEIPVHENNAGDDYALNSQLYSYLSFLNTGEYQQEYQFPSYHIDLLEVFGANNLKILSSPKIQVSQDGVINEEGMNYIPKSIETACPDYPFSNCVWVSTTNHYSGRNGHTLSALAMHTVQGSYAGCVSWFQNTSSSASTQYVVRSSDGQLTQMVLESDAAWHVTTENYYTVGYEHEGYVDNPAWYTTAMYNSSAALSRDICAAWGINPLRTFCRDTLDDGTALDYGLHNLGAEGSCIKIKGHQHYPNQSHTDPAQYWNWNHYFKLMNPSPAPTTYTAASGTFYDTGGASANYGDDERLLWLIAPANASSVTITFSSFAMETNYDFLYIYNGDNVFAPCLGRWNTVSPGTVTANSGKMLIEFRSDCLTTAAGWTASWTSAGIDNIAPTTTISSPGNWKTANFTATFTDADNSGGSGVEKSYYQVLDNNGTEWRANNTNGFFADNFDLASINADWSVATGNWVETNGYLEQKDTSNTNTNIYATLNQTLSNRYLYHFTAKLGSGVSGSSQRRFGFHFFSDNGSLANRGNSYFIFFRQETSRLEFYKVANDVFTQVKVVDNITINIGQLYDIKVIYDRISGKMDVYRDNVLLGTWTDTSPYSTGNYISFRSGNSHLYVGELKIFRSRAAMVPVTVGAAATNDIRYQNPNPTTFGAKIKSIVNDAAGNLSVIASHDLNVDWTPPSDITAVFDGLSNDIDTIYVNNELSANWASSTDPNSGIAHYWYAVGTTAGGTDVIDWTDNGTAVNFIASGLSLSYNQKYYVSVKSEDGAGLFSNVTSSDGVFVKQAVSQPVAGFTYSNTFICEGTPIDFINTSTNATTYNWAITGPAGFNSSAANPSIHFTASGSYFVELIANGPGGADTTAQTVDITVYANPDANAGNDAAVCNGESVTLNAAGGAIYQWNSGVSNGVAFIPIQTADYIVTVTDTHNCTDTDTVTVTVNPVPDANAGNNQTLCAGESVTLTATGGDTYLWDHGVTNDVPFTPLDSAIYTVTVTNSFGCPDIASVAVNVIPIPVAAFDAVDTLLVYPNTSAVFMNNSIHAASYLWDFGDGYTSYDENPWHTYDTTGYYTIILYAHSASCGTDTLVMTNYIHIVLPSGISEIHNSSPVLVYPNPFTSELYVNLGEPANHVQIKLVDILGRELYVSNISKNSGLISLKEFSAKIANGIYNLLITVDGKTTSVPVVK